MPKAIVITEDNRSMLKDRFPTVVDDEQLPIGYWIIAEFGSVEWSTLDPVTFQDAYLKVTQIENGWWDVVKF